MKKIIIIMLAAFLFMGSAHGVFAAESTSSTSGKCPPKMKEVSSGSDNGVTICCPEMPDKPHGAGGGNSGGPNGAQQMAAKNKAMINKTKEEAAIVNKQNQASAESMSDFIMNKCLAGINSNIFSSLSSFSIGSIFKDVMSALVNGAAAAACNLVHDASQTAINTAIDKATINLPGVGTVGANTTLLGHDIIRSDTVNGIQNSTLMSKRPPANVSGVVIFQRGGGVLMNRGGIGNGILGSSVQQIDPSMLIKYGK